MKKRALLILVLAASLLLCVCGKSEAAAAADEQIASIGEVKIESITLSKNAAELKEGRRTLRRATAGNLRTRALQRWMRMAS